jgi:WD40 repeat protein/serine/threonine protein kinase
VTAKQPANSRWKAAKFNALSCCNKKLTKEDDMPAVNWQVGDLILGTYLVKPIAGCTERPYAEGGMGRVYRVFHRSWGIDLAAKVPLSKAFGNALAREAFIDECQTWVNLALHPHVVTCYYVRRIEDLPVVFSEFIDGGTLGDWISSGKIYTGGSRQALGMILDIAIQMAWGLHHAHQQGIVHQDVKPANVMMATEGIAKITDFGLAKGRNRVVSCSSADGYGAAQATYAGMTPAYCSPQQAEMAMNVGTEGISLPKLTRHTDMWSWAVSVLEMFVGARTWTSGLAAPAVLAQYLKEGPMRSDVPSMPPAVADMLATCLLHNPEDRFPDMSSLAVNLRELYSHVAGEEYKRAIPKIVEIRASGLNNKAISLLDLHDEMMSRRLLDQAIRMDPLHAEATYNRGLLDWRCGNLTDDSLLAQLSAIQTVHRADWRPYLLACLVHLERGDAKSVLEMLSRPPLNEQTDREVHAAFEQARNLPQSAGQCIRTLSDHTGNLTDLVATADGRFLLSSAWDHTIRLWRLPDLECDCVLTGHSEAVVGIAVSASGRLALSGGNDGVICLWDLESGTCLRTIEERHGKIWSVALSPAGDAGLVATDDHNVWHYDLDSSRCVRAFSGHRGLVSGMQIAHGGKTLVTTSWDGTLVRWDFASGAAILLVDLYAGKLNSVATSPDGRVAMAGCEDMSLRLVDLAAGKLIRSFNGHSGGPRAAAFLPNGMRCLSGSYDNTLRLWEIASGRCLRTFAGHEKSVNAVVVSPDGLAAYSGSSDNTIRAWDLTTGRASPFAISRPQPTPRLATFGDEHKTKLMQARHAIENGDISLSLQLINEARAIPEFANSSKALDLLAGAGRRCRRLGLASVLSYALKGPGAAKATCLSIESNDREAVIISKGGILGACSSDKAFLTTRAEEDFGRLALVGFSNGDVRFFDLRRHEAIGSIESQPTYVAAVQFSPGGQQCQVWPRLKLPRYYDIETLQLVDCADEESNTSEEFSERGKDLPFADDGLSAAPTTSWDGQIQLSCDRDESLNLYDQKTNSRVMLASGSSSPVECAAILPDGRYGFSGSRDGVVRIWDLANQRCVHFSQGNHSAITSLACSLDGRWLVAGSEDGSVRLWELVWEYEFPGWADWSGDARAQIDPFLARSGIKSLTDWTDELQWRWLLDLQCVGMGWLPCRAFSDDGKLMMITAL